MTTEATTEYDYLALNAGLNLYGQDGKIQFDKDKEAARAYFLGHVNQNMVWFHNLEEKLNYLFEEGYYEKEHFDLYTPEFIKSAYKHAYAYKFRFPTFVGALKFYSSYALKTRDGSRYLERFEDRVVTVALVLAEGDEERALRLIDETITGRFQPATPTFLNLGRVARGEPVSCFLLRTEDNMESISRSINGALQLSKRGGGVAINLTNLREAGSPIQRVANASSGVIPVMKLLDLSFSYADQLGARKGAGAVYLHAHHPDIMAFLDTKRENADERIRIKTLSTGIVMPDITFELAKRNEDMYLFSPYDVERVYGKPLSDISVTEEYENMVNNSEINKKKISARHLLSVIAELQIQSGYPYILFEDTANRENPIKGRINMSNLCSEILQVNSPSEYNESLDYTHVGKDISCNLGSMNIAKAMEGGNLEKTVEEAIRALTRVSEMSNINSVPSIERGNQTSHAIGLGQMNLHGFFGKEHMYYGDEDSIEFTSVYFAAIAYYALKASNTLAVEKGATFEGFEDSKYADGTYFDKYVNQDWTPTRAKVQEVFEKYGITVPTREEWVQLKADIMRDGIYNRNLQAVPPTGSISYINNSTSSIHPLAALIEIRKESKIGRVYYPAYGATNDNLEFYQDAYEIGNEKIIDVYAAAGEHVDQGLSCTLFFPEGVTTRDINKAQIYAWRKGLKTLYYVRLRDTALAGTELDNCVSCTL